jgi:hypothetical protein
VYKQLVIACVLLGSCLMSGEFELALSQMEKDVIEEIVTLVGEVEDAELMKMTDQIVPKIMKMMAVPPLQIIAEIALDRSLRENFLKASESPFKWSMIVKGFSMRMNQEVLSIGFEEKMESFLCYLSLEGNNLKGYIEKKEWGNFISTLLKSIET